MILALARPIVTAALSMRTYGEAAEEALVRAEARHLHQPGLLQAQEGPLLLLVVGRRFLLLLLLVLLLASPPDRQSRGRISSCNNRRCSQIR
jgi:hypothetical protein